jgi:hypothetical protein
MHPGEQCQKSHSYDVPCHKINWIIAALISTDRESIQEALNKILAVGETSEADALVGFIGALGGGGKVQNPLIFLLTK